MLRLLRSTLVSKKSQQSEISKKIAFDGRFLTGYFLYYKDAKKNLIGNLNFNSKQELFNKDQLEYATGAELKLKIQEFDVLLVTFMLRKQTVFKIFIGK